MGLVSRKWYLLVRIRKWLETEHLGWVLKVEGISIDRDGMGEASTYLLIEKLILEALRGEFL